MQLKKGKHRFRYSPCNNFTLLHGGNVYHSRDHRAGTECVVNVVKDGEYTTNRKCVHSFLGDIDTNGNEIQLPAPERDRIREVVFRYNPEIPATGTPARIFTNMRPAVIEIGPRFFTMPIQSRLFILFHEYAHLFYETEWKVDQLALKLFLDAGYNPSQAVYALTKVLRRSNPESMERITALFNNLKQAGHAN